MNPCSIAVVGCGPAGLAAALLLARMGHDVALYERFQSPRPLGSGLMLQPSGMAVLGMLGLAEETVRRGARIDRLLGITDTGRTVLDARYGDLAGPASCGIGIHRSSLFDVLLAAARASGLSLRPDHDVIATRHDARGRWLEFRNQPGAGPFDLVVDASGLHTPLAEPCGRELPFGALWATLPWPQDGPFLPHRLEQRYRRARQMVGVLPIGNRPGAGAELALFWSLRTADVDQWHREGLGVWRDAVARLWPDCAHLVEQITDPAQVTMARYAHRTVAHPARPRLVHIGDAWHTASPQLGQGANMGLLDAAALAAAVDLTRDMADVPEMTVHLRRWHVTLYQWVTAFFTPLYQSDAAVPAVVRDWLFAPASRLWPGKPIQALLMSGLAGRPLGRLGLERVDYRALRLP